MLGQKCQMFYDRMLGKAPRCTVGLGGLCQILVGVFFMIISPFTVPWMAYSILKPKAGLGDWKIARKEYQRCKSENEPKRRTRKQLLHVVFFPISFVLNGLLAGLACGFLMLFAYGPSFILNGLAEIFLAITNKHPEEVEFI